ncbi:MAG TPA: hypothetical protein VMU87_17350 [Stellaceae bacterium]|nr:hypothetical protein [Stellaceae bacterium]
MAVARLFGLRTQTAAAAPANPPSSDMMGGGMDDMMGSGNMAGPMRTGMALFARHSQIRRTVTELPSGIHAVTESDDPQTAAIIQAHVSDMYQRLDAKRAFPYPMSRSVPAMFAHSADYRRTLAATPKGIAVTETSDDPAMVAVIRAHARELNGFVRDGMPAMMRGMMR